MKILVIGSGGREHALCWKLAQSPGMELYACPGNPGMARVAVCMPGEPLDAALRIGADLTVVGPEVPLVAGVVDAFRAKGLRIVGPNAEAAQLEGSKIFAKNFFIQRGIPTAGYETVEGAFQARLALRRFGYPVVLKADGLAAGKGVVVAHNEQEAEAALETLTGRLVIEEFLTGTEVSFIALCDGRDALPLAASQDHKAVFDGDQGPNTGGMGAYSPAPVMTPALCHRVMLEIIEPTVRAMADAGTKFKGVLYAGLMIDQATPKLIEYNVRFGDPECQALMLRLDSDLLPALLATAEGRLDGVKLEWSDDAALCVVMAAKGYPGTYAKGSEIKGLAEAAREPGVQIFHAGTRRDVETRDRVRILADGGRVLGVTAKGCDIREAQARAYAAVDKIDWSGGFCRRDIGWRAVERDKESSEPAGCAAPLQ